MVSPWTSTRVSWLDRKGPEWHGLNEEAQSLHHDVIRCTRVEQEMRWTCRVRHLGHTMSRGGLHRERHFGQHPNILTNHAQSGKFYGQIS